MSSASHTPNIRQTIIMQSSPVLHTQFLSEVLPQPTLSIPRFEHHPDGFGLNHRRPRISWRFSHPSDAKSEAVNSWVQSAYDIEIRRQGSMYTNSYHVESSESVLVPWPGRALDSAAVAAVRVRSYGGTSGITGWSPWATAEAALLEEGRWSAPPIAPSKKFEKEDTTLRPVRFRKAFSLPQTDVVKARLYITALGLYEVYLNGTRVGDHVLAPGWTSYSHRLAYQMFDVTALLSQGNNVISAEVGEGWYAGLMGIRGGQRFNYGNELALLLQLEVMLDNGEVIVQRTDGTWKCHPSATITSEIYNGERYDMSQEQSGWKLPDFDDASWTSVKLLPMPSAALFASDAEPVRVTQEVKPVSIITSPSGKTIFDFGQNLVGFVRIRKVAPRSEVSIVHAEVLVDGEMGMRPLRAAKCTDTVVTSDTALLGWCPKFTYHGFRYMQLSGWPEGEEPSIEDFTALVIHTDMRRRGWFKCSNPLVNKLHDNIVWGMRGNFVSVPTDCPQRDERLGWTGDIQVFGPTASFLYDTMGILGSWLEDLSAEQMAHEEKIPPLVCPDVMADFWTPTPQAVWHDVTILTPWDLYQSSSDLEVLRRQYPSMVAWLDTAIRRGTDRLWDINIWQLGDWVDPAAPPSEPGNGRTDGVLVADAYLVHITTTMSRVCSALGLEVESKLYALDAIVLKGAFRDKYITPLGNLANFTQAAIALAVQFDLYPGLAQLATARQSLVRLVHKAHYHVSTGFAGTPAILPALTKVGEAPLAYRMLMERHCPSWLYPVTMGATTVWERWDALLPDGSLNPGQMLSFNHYALGAVAAWLHSTVGGISSVDGWRTVVVRPIPGGRIDQAETQFDGPYGRVECKWTVEEDKFKMDLLVPPNSRAQVTLPAAQRAGEEKTVAVGSGSHVFECSYEADEWPPRATLGSYSGPRGTVCGCS
ncbi:Uncharacterized protein BP5553_03501 [Venustampulla echinocandica]|uniref:alpha-L-rhamnosidase n=1 Tax=Venustampulla echinocandica TaxID=2656787 RepID=A0A370TUF6_9HELO|nr:Uncharacterized protein BP5553_03501 [Venustampulla echinocandica]RDL39161.1 Uncharacterized protein BP5553_03501 [Venustampulla echinocandica]